MKLNKKQIRKLPKEVAARVLEDQARYHTRFCEYKQTIPGWKLYLAEGVTYSAFDKNGNYMSTIQMQASHSLHVGNWQSHRIGDRIPIPEGAWVVSFRLFMGKPFIRIFHAGPYQIGA